MLSVRTKMVLIPLAILSMMGSSVMGLLTYSKDIENQAEVVAIGLDVYWDITAVNAVNNINWGELRPGENKTITIYVKNTGGYKITGSFDTMNWEPPFAADYISLSWDFGTWPLLPDRIRTTDLTIHVDSAIENVTNFYFTLVVTGTQYVEPG